MLNELVIAGFGGQGAMLMGQLLSYAGMYEGKSVSWIPSYGPEMRGGTANCSVVLSSGEIGSPLVNEPNVLIVLNRPSLDKFESTVKPGGTIIYNSSMIDRVPNRPDVKIIAIPANEIAREIGSDKVANMVLLGACLKATGCVSKDTLIDVLKKKMSEKAQALLPLNKAAIERGMELV